MSRTTVDFGRTRRPDAWDRFWAEEERMNREYDAMLRSWGLHVDQHFACNPAPKRDPNEAGSFLERACR